MQLLYLGYLLDLYSIYIYIDINLYQLQYCGISIILPSGKVTKLSKIAI